jgi:hypothetical protein
MAALKVRASINYKSFHAIAPFVACPSICPYVHRYLSYRAACAPLPHCPVQKSPLRGRTLHTFRVVVDGIVDGRGWRGARRHTADGVTMSTTPCAPSPPTPSLGCTRALGTPSSTCPSWPHSFLLLAPLPPLLSLLSLDTLLHPLLLFVDLAPLGLYARNLHNDIA